MRVMVLVKATVDSEAGTMPTTELMEAMARYNEELAAAGVIKAGEGLRPSAEGKRVRFRGAAREVVDGPFPHAEELVAGFWLWEVRDVAEAIEWAKRCPEPMPGGGVLEIRPLYEAADFGELMTPELVGREERLRERLADG